MKSCVYGAIIMVGSLFFDAPGLIIGEATFAPLEAATGVHKKGDTKMIAYLRSEEITEIHLRVGERVLLESLRQAVVPPYLMIMPYYVLPDFIRYVESQPLKEDGVHGTIFVLDAHAPGEGELTIGFKDMQSGAVTHQKELTITVMDEGH